LDVARGRLASAGLSGQSSFPIFEDELEPAPPEMACFDKDSASCEMQDDPQLPPVQGFGNETMFQDQGWCDPDGYGSPANLAKVLVQSIDSDVMPMNESALSAGFEDMDVFAPLPPSIQRPADIDFEFEDCDVVMGTGSPKD